MPAPTLAELIAPGRTALVFQELQNGVVTDDGPFPALVEACREVGVLDNSATLARAARSAGVPVVHATAESLPDGFGVNHNARLFFAARAAGADNAPGTESVQPVASLYAPGDVVLPRYHGLSPLTGSQLDSLLRNLGITTLVVAGVSLNVAIPNLVFDGVNRSYQVVLPTDAVAGTPVGYGQDVLHHGLRVVATLTTSAEIAQAWSVRDPR